MPKNKLVGPYFKDQQWNVDEHLDASTTLGRTFDTRAEAEEFIDEYNKQFDPTDKDMWRKVLTALQYDKFDPTDKNMFINEGKPKGYLFDYFKSLESQIEHWLEAHRG